MWAKIFQLDHKPTFYAWKKFLMSNSKNLSLAGQLQRDEKLFPQRGNLFCKTITKCKKVADCGNFRL